MNKKMRELLNKIRTITAEARKKQDDGDITGATELLNQVTDTYCCNRYIYIVLCSGCKPL